MPTSTCNLCGAARPDLNTPCGSCLLRLGLGAEEEQGLEGELITPVTPGPDTEIAEEGNTSEGGGNWQFRLVRILGEGAFGTVWEAEQTAPVRRSVAIKILKLGMDSREVVTRFEAERQALALMNHPGIARVFDGGMTKTGRPYFAMELVTGLPIHRYCDEHRLGIRARLELIMEVCHAVQHAHQKGVVHRDLKPTNILVAGPPHAPVAKVIDFGIAKAIGTELTDRTLFTRHNQVLGTPAYMSPEQSLAGASDIDTRTDVYAIGAILYELLVGQPPAEDPGTGTVRSLRELAQTNPPVPSVHLLGLKLPRLVEIASRRGTPAPALKSAVRGDLDWIAVKALEPDRTRRYQSASELALDLQRHLANQPVSARSPSVGYRWRKFVQRHRVAVWLSGIFLGLLLSAVIVSIVLAIQANEERHQALAARESESQRRIEAQEARDELRKQVYISDMGLVQDTLRADNLARARDLLLRHRPVAGGSDLRAWEWRFFWDRSLVPARNLLPDHHKPIRSVAISRNGRWLAWGDDGGAIGLCDLAKGTPGPLLETGVGDPAVVTFSPATDELAAGITQGLMKLWTTEGWVERTRLTEEGWVRCLAYSPSGSWLAAMSDALHISLWQPERTNRLGTTPIGALRDIHKSRMAFAPDRPWLAVGETDGMIRILRLPSLEEQLQFPGAGPGADGITALEFSPDGKILLSGSGYNDTAIRLWRPADGSPVGELSGHRGWVTALAFSADGKTLASASVDQTIRLWNWETRTERMVLRGHQHEISSIAFSPDGTTLVSGSRAGEVFLWGNLSGPPEANPIAVAGENIRQARISPDSTALATWHWNGGVTWRSLAHPGPGRQLAQLGTNNYGLTFSPDGGMLAIGTRVGSIRLVDTTTFADCGICAGEPSGRMLPIGYTKDGTRLLGVARVTPVPIAHFWEMPSRRPRAVWPLTARNHRVALSSDGRFVATGDFDGTVRLWEPETGRELAVMGAHESEVLGIEFAPNGEILVSGSNSGDLIIWDVLRRTSIARLRSQAGGIYSLTFSPDGRRLVTGGNWQRAIQLWDLETRQIIGTLPAEGPLHDNVLFSRDGNALLSINSDGQLQMWRARSLAAIDAGAPAQPGRPAAPDWPSTRH